jgi:hypothetical protein
MTPVSLCTEILQKETFSSETFLVSLLQIKELANPCSYHGGVDTYSGLWSHDTV